MRRERAELRAAMAEANAAALEAVGRAERILKLLEEQERVEPTPSSSAGSSPE